MDVENSNHQFFSSCGSRVFLTALLILRLDKPDKPWYSMWGIRGWI